MEKEQVKEVLDDDAELQAMIGKLRVIEPQIFCNSGNKIAKICSNPKCKFALQCGQIKCKDCGIKNHTVCTSIPLSSVTYLLNERVDEYKNLISTTLQLDKKVIKAIEDSQKELIADYNKTNLSEKTQKIVDNIYKKKELKSVSGKQGQQLVETLQAINATLSVHVKSVVKKYEDSITKLMEELINLKKQLISQYLQSQQKKEFQQSRIEVKKEEKYTKNQLQFLLEALTQQKHLAMISRCFEEQFQVTLEKSDVWTKIKNIHIGDKDLNIIAKVNSVFTYRQYTKNKYILGDETGTIQGWFEENKYLKIGQYVMLFKVQATDIERRTELQLMDGGKIISTKPTINKNNEEKNIPVKSLDQLLKQEDW